MLLCETTIFRQQLTGRIILLYDEGENEYYVLHIFCRVRRGQAKYLSRRSSEASDVYRRKNLHIGDYDNKFLVIPVFCTPLRAQVTKANILSRLQLSKKKILRRNSYSVFFFKKKNTTLKINITMTLTNINEQTLINNRQLV